jgi:hypothetical protein
MFYRSGVRDSCVVGGKRPEASYGGLFPGLNSQSLPQGDRAGHKANLICFLNVFLTQADTKYWNAPNILSHT